jgi:hypothetical protein
MICAGSTDLHWNYFLALEADLERASRYVEFVPANYSTYSIEFAHLLFAASSEVDVVMKGICEHLDPHAPRDKISDYQNFFARRDMEFHEKEICVPRYNLTLHPWENWGSGRSPDWWTSYNKVKHHRSTHFEEATLAHALNAMAALLVMTTTYYGYKKTDIPAFPGTSLPLDRLMLELRPESQFMRLPEHVYAQPYVRLLGERTPS